jgi:hypothetical protein
VRPLRSIYQVSIAEIDGAVPVIENKGIESLMELMILEEVAKVALHGFVDGREEHLAVLQHMHIHVLKSRLTTLTNPQLQILLVFN